MRIITLIITILISGIPFASIFYLMKLPFVKNTVRSLTMVIILVALSFSAPFIAMKIYEAGVPKHIDMNRLDNGCDLTPVVFVFLGFIFTILTLIFGLIFTYTNYKTKTRNTLK